MTRLKIRLGSIGIVMLLVMVGCQSSLPASTQAVPADTQAVPADTQAVPTTQAATAITQDNTIVWAHSTEPRTIDPHISYSGSITRNAINIYESLTRYKYGTLELEPSLATEWVVSEDGKSYIFTLREGVKFQDGTDFNAEAVKLSYDRYKAIGEGQLIAQYDNAEILGPYQIKINLLQRYIPFIGMTSALWIVSPTAVEEHKTAEDPWAKKWFYDHSAGTGPYELVRWDHEQQIIFEAFDDYWRGWEPGTPLRVIHRVIKEAATQRLLLEAGDVDFAMNMSIDDAQALKDNPEIVIETHDTLVGFYLKMVTFKGPLQDVRVRRAMQYAFPYPDLLELSNGLWKNLEGPLPASLPYAKQYPVEYNLDKARELLSEAGYPNGGFELTVAVTTGFEVQMRSAELLQFALSELGIKLNIVVETFGAIVASWDDPETTPDISGNFVYPSYPDPDAILFDMYPTQFFPPAGGNPNRYSNKEVDNLLLLGQEETDPILRARIYERIQDILVADAPDIFAANPGYIIFYRSRVENYMYHPAHHDTIQFYELRLNPNQ